MLMRLVRMYIRAEEVAAFLKLYKEARSIIIAQAGCRSVLLMQQIDDPTAFATWSVWDDATALDAYRTSDFFRRFWPEVRALFRAPAEAVSFEQVNFKYGGELEEGPRKT